MRHFLDCVHLGDFSEVFIDYSLYRPWLHPQLRNNQACAIQKEVFIKNISITTNAEIQVPLPPVILRIAGEHCTIIDKEEKYR